jgi:hypothetical protein
MRDAKRSEKTPLNDWIITFRGNGLRIKKTI